MAALTQWILHVQLSSWLTVPARFVFDLTAHPVGTTGFAALLAYFLAERWQTWRQRRDFQHRAMVDFAEDSIALINILTRFQPGLSNEQFVKFIEDYRAKFEALVAHDAQLYAVFSERTLVNNMYVLTSVMNEIPRQCRSGADQATLRRAVKSVSAMRRLMIGRMAKEMSLRSKDAFARLRREIDPDLAPPAGFAPTPPGPTTPPIPVDIDTN